MNVRRTYHCSYCDRYFVNGHALDQHLSSGRHAYCYRCGEGFADDKDLAEHRRVSLSHWECARCISNGSEYDYATRALLREHYRVDPDHNICEECEADFWTANELQQV